MDIATPPTERVFATDTSLVLLATTALLTTMALLAIPV